MTDGISTPDLIAGILGLAGFATSIAALLNSNTTARQSRNNDTFNSSVQPKILAIEQDIETLIELFAQASHTKSKKHAELDFDAIETQYISVQRRINNKIITLMTMDEVSAYVWEPIPSDTFDRIEEILFKEESSTHGIEIADLSKIVGWLQDLLKSIGNATAENRRILTKNIQTFS